MKAIAAESLGPSATLVQFVSALRAKGLAIGPGETLDAAQALVSLGVSDRGTVLEALKATLLHGQSDESVFEDLFDLWFGGPPLQELPGASSSDENLKEQLASALLEGDVRVIERLAVVAVDVYGSLDPSLSRSRNSWSALQTLGAIGRNEVFTLAQGLDEEVSADLRSAKLAHGWQLYERRVSREVRLRTAAIRGAERVAEYGVKQSAYRQDFLNASVDELKEIQRLVTPLARRIAIALSVKSRQSRRGQLDLRRTIRASLSTGGVPVKTVSKRRKATRPRLVVLCDVSGSVAGFSGFTSILLASISQSIQQIRIFPFVNRIAEATYLTRAALEPTQFMAELVSDQGIRAGHSNSDYGQALDQFREQYLESVGRRTTVLILGDARSNGQPPSTEALLDIRSRAGRVYWLNPERQALWGTGDSLAPEYRRVVTMRECRNVSQLEDFVRRSLV